MPEKCVGERRVENSDLLTAQGPLPAGCKQQVRQIGHREVWLKEDVFESKSGVVLEPFGNCEVRGGGQLSS